MSDAIIVAIDKLGRVVIPKEIRDEAGIEPGMPLVISCREGRIEIEPRRRAIRIVKRGRLQVAEAVDAEGGVLSSADVAETVERSRKGQR